MAECYVIEDGYLVSFGYAPDGAEQHQAIGNQQVMMGKPPGFDIAILPHDGARWHVQRQCWVDTRNAEQQDAQARHAVLVSRRSAYPPLEDYVDAVYWQSRGDGSKMEAYLAAIDAVKAQFPKL